MKWLRRMKMHKSNIDLSVLLIFFARPNTLKEVFAKVKKARPSRLFLACDGPRNNNPLDAKSIEECKKIVSEIDWECEVFTNYSKENLGCGKGPSNAISWAFKSTDKLVILEDDCVPDDTYFTFMKEMLDFYENDSRIGLISGFNHLKHWDCDGNSYCFTKAGATLGWGTWKRVWEKYDFYVKDIENPYVSRLLQKEVMYKRVGISRIKEWKRAANETPVKKVRYWDYQFDFLKYFQSYLSIVPTGNLIHNIGVGIGSTHTENNKPVAWKPGRVLFMPTEPMQFPIKHPKYVICDRAYDEMVFNKILYPPKFIKLVKKIKRYIINFFK